MPSRFLGFVLASNLIFYVPVIVLYFQARGMSISQTFALVAVYSVVLALADVPTSAFADVFGRRGALVASAALGITGAVLLATGTNFLVLAAGQACVALALATRSGAQSAYLFVVGGARAYSELEPKAATARYLGLALSALAGGTLYALNPDLAFAATVAALVLGLVILLTLPQGPLGERGAARSVLQTISSAARVTFGAGPLRTLVPVFAVLSSLTGLAYWSFQIYLASVGISFATIGLAYALYFAAAAGGSRIAAALNRSVGERTGLLLACAALALAFAGMATIRHPLGAAIPLVVQVVTGYLLPTLYVLLQAVVPDDRRATILSLESSVGRSLVFAGSFGFAAVIEAAGLPTAFLACAVVSLLVLLAVQRNVSANLSLSLRRTDLGSALTLDA